MKNQDTDVIDLDLMDRIDSALETSRDNLLPTEKLLEQYDIARPRLRDLASRVFGTLRRADMKRGANDLRLWVEGQIVFEYECEMNLYMDYVLYDLRSSAGNYITQYLVREKGRLNETDRTLLEAASVARFTVTSIVGSIKDVGVFLFDHFTQSVTFIVDRAMSQSEVTALVQGMRLITWRDICFSSGASVPVDDEMMSAFYHGLNPRDQARVDNGRPIELSRAAQRRLSRMLKRHAIDSGMTEGIAFG